LEYLHLQLFLLHNTVTSNAYLITS
jgi:hypothetical protein